MDLENFNIHTILLPIINFHGKNSDKFGRTRAKKERRLKVEGRHLDATHCSVDFDFDGLLVLRWRSMLSVIFNSTNMIEFRNFGRNIGTILWIVNGVCKFH